MVVVSILTGPFGPVQPPLIGGSFFIDNVSILTGPFGPVQPARPPTTPPLTMFQSSPALSGRCNRFPGVVFGDTLIVSILTGPFGPVQLR